jgi:hypothetical protein
MIELSELLVIGKLSRIFLASIRTPFWVFWDLAQWMKTKIMFLVSFKLCVYLVKQYMISSTLTKRDKLSIYKNRTKTMCISSLSWTSFWNYRRCLGILFAQDKQRLFKSRHSFHAIMNLNSSIARRFIFLTFNTVWMDFMEPIIKWIISTHPQSLWCHQCQRNPAI